MTLRPVDYLVIVGYLIAITLFGSWFARFQRTTRDYFLTDRSIPWWAICFTIVATETSTLSFIGVPAAAFTGNMTFLQLAAGYVIGRVLISLVFIPAYFKGELFTSYELLQQRFGSAVKTLAASIFLGTRTLADGVRLFATALVIAVVTGVPVGWTVVALGAAMIVYTVRGGVSAVIWTDVVQMFVYLAGAGAVFFVLLSRVPGGWTEIVAAGLAAGKFTVIDLSFDWTRTYTLWAGLLGGAALTLATHGTDQYLVQRLLSARSARHAGLGLVLSGVLVFAQFALFLIIGVMLFAYYQHTPAPALGRADEVLPRFIVTTVSGGMAGFIVAATSTAGTCARTPMRRPSCVSLEHRRSAGASLKLASRWPRSGWIGRCSTRACWSCRSRAVRCWAPFSWASSAAASIRRQFSPGWRVASSRWL